MGGDLGRAGGEQGELVTTEVGEEVPTTTGRCLPRGGRDLEQAVAGVVAVDVVHRFEAVEAADHNRHGLPAAHGALDVRAQTRREGLVWRR